MEPFGTWFRHLWMKDLILNDGFGVGVGVSLKMHGESYSKLLLELMGCPDALFGWVDSGLSSNKHTQKCLSCFFVYLRILCGSKYLYIGDLFMQREVKLEFDHYCSSLLITFWTSIPRRRGKYVNCV